MNLSELRREAPKDLLKLAQKMGIENLNNMRKQDMAFAILKSLAKKGYWVNGTSDSLGENYSPEESPFKKTEWLKVTHQNNKNDDKEILVTYKLEPLKISDRIKDCHYFYYLPPGYKEKTVFQKLEKEKLYSGIVILIYLGKPSKR